MKAPETASAKPQKPRPDFPLFPHATGRWAKKVKGKLRYFGKVDDDPHGQRALAKWHSEMEDLLAGRVPRPKEGGFTVKDLLNQFRASKKLAAESGEITVRAFREYHKTMDRIRDTFGLTRLVTDLAADDFQKLRAAIAKTLGLAAQKVEMARARAVFNFAYNNGFIDRPVRFGSDFKAPSEKAIRRLRAGNAPKMFEPHEIATLLSEAATDLKAMILLGVNCGFGNNDLATLTRVVVDLDVGWVTHPRPKTGVPRRAKLWPETVAALRDAYARRPEPANPAHADLVFLTPRCGEPVVRTNKASWTDSVGLRFWELLKKTKLLRPGRGFYGLRHTFETVGGESLDQVAVNHVMGHVDGTMAATYRERVTDERLEKVADHVRRWLFGEAKANRKAAGKTRSHGLRVVG